MSKEKKKLKFPQYISTNIRTISVEGYIDKGDDSKLYVENKGYVDNDGNIWIYTKEKPKGLKADAYPYFWFEDGEKKFNKVSEFIRKIYSVDNLRDIDIVSIINKTKEGEVLYNEEEILDINASSNFYIPIIKESDDFLKKIVKMVIIEKGINIKRLKSKTDMSYTLPNMITALNNDTKMSVNYFISWLELLGCSFDVTIRDNGNDKVNPLKYDHIYENDTNKTVMICNNKEVPVDMSKYYMSSK